MHGRKIVKKGFSMHKKPEKGSPPVKEVNGHD